MKKDILHEFGSRIRFYRMALGLTQEGLAQKAGLHVNYIGGIERSLRNPSLTCILDLAAALEMTVNDLLLTFSDTPEV